MRTYIELDKKALANNIKLIKQALGQTQLALVLKSNAYGHGLQEIGNYAQESPEVNWICTAGLQEAIALRLYNVHKPIIVLSYLDSDYSSAIAYDIHCAIYDLDTARELSKKAQELRKTAYVHIKVDSGMSRLGVLPEDVLKFVKTVSQLPYIKIFGIFTHLCDTPNPDPSFCYQQLDTFDAVLDNLENAGISIPCTHAIASSGLCITPKREYTLARIGGSTFGLWKSESHKSRVLKNYPLLQNLQPVLTWKTKIIQIKDIAAQSYIGYDRTYQAQHHMRVAILPIGYADGYPRSFSNKGIVLVNNQEAPIIGIVSMSLAAIDVTHIKNIRVQDEVILVGSEKPVQALACAQRAQIITNELLARIDSDIPRTITNQVQAAIQDKVPVYEQPVQQPVSAPEAATQHGRAIEALNILFDLNKLH